MSAKKPLLVKRWSFFRSNSPLQRQIASTSCDQHAYAEKDWSRNDSLSRGEARLWQDPPHLAAEQITRGVCRLLDPQRSQAIFVQVMREVRAKIDLNMTGGWGASTAVGCSAISCFKWFWILCRLSRGSGYTLQPVKGFPAKLIAGNIEYWISSIVSWSRCLCSTPFSKICAESCNGSQTLPHSQQKAAYSPSSLDPAFCRWYVNL